MQASFDIIIVGHGLAGALLAHRFLAKGQRIMVLDQEEHSSASRIAAGIINPVTGHRLNITNGFNELMPVAIEMYTELSTLFGDNIFSRVNQVRLLKNQSQFSYYQKRHEKAEYRDIFGSYMENADDFIAANFGAIEVKQSAIVDTSKLLTLSKKSLLAQNSFRALNFDYKKLEYIEGKIYYGDLEAKRIIFCEGHMARKNPWLKELPFKLAKGEIVNIKLEQPAPPFLNWGSWLIPTADPRVCRLGSTYEWQDLTMQATRSDALLSNLQTFTGLTGDQLSTDVGIRPTTVHRTPFVGPIQKLNNSYCFNGFGSKGCLLIPNYARQLVDHILDSKPLSEEVTKWL